MAKSQPPSTLKTSDGDHVPAPQPTMDEIEREFGDLDPHDDPASIGGNSSSDSSEPPATVDELPPPPVPPPIPPPPQNDEEQGAENVNHRDATPVSTTPKRQGRRQLMFIFLALLCVVIILQGVIIGILVDRNNDDNSNGAQVGNAVNDADDRSSSTVEPSSKPSQQLLSSPPTSLLLSSLPSLPPSLTPTATGTIEGFQSIANLPNVQNVEELRTCDTATSAGICAIGSILTKPIKYGEGGEMVRVITVWAGGRMTISTDIVVVEVVAAIFAPHSGNVYTVEHNYDDDDGDVVSTQERSSVMQNKTARPTQVRKDFTVSWEGMSFIGSPQTFVNAQASFYSNGIVELCYGDARVDPTNQFKAGIWDAAMGQYQAADLGNIGDFDVLGISRPGFWPTNQCKRFFASQSRPPTIQPSAYQPAQGYTSIANLDGAVRLEYLSAQDEGSEFITLQDDIKWMGRYETRRLEIYVNGRINIWNCQFEQKYGSIQVVGADLDATEVGNVWVLDRLNSESTIVISWEGLRFAGYPTDPNFVHAQAYLFQNGDIRMCYGSANGEDFPPFTAAVTDFADGCRQTAQGYPFDSQGTTSWSTWPSNQCFLFAAEQACSNLGGMLTATPSLSPTISPAPTETPSTRPTEEPTATNTCTSTAGRCATTYSELSWRVSTIRPGDTISICGTIRLLQTIEIAESRVTLCCGSSAECRLEIAGTNRILAVTGSDFTLHDITFWYGTAPSDGLGGGNVVINSSGHHRIFGCYFAGGIAASQNGGNLNVIDADALRIERSTFFNANSGYGGGLAIIDTNVVTILDSFFDSNSADAGGGAIFITILNELNQGQQTNISGTTFIDNTGDWGGAILATSMGSMPSLSMYECTFIANVARSGGGIGSLFYYDDDFQLDYSRNSGFDNEDLSNVESCDGIAVYSSFERCIGVKEDYKYPFHLTQLPSALLTTSMSPSPSIINNPLASWQLTSSIDVDDFPIRGGMDFSGSVSLSLSGLDLLMAPRIRPGTGIFGGRISGRPLAVLFQPSREGGWVSSDDRTVTARPDFGNELYDNVGIQAAFARDARTRMIVRYPRFATIDGPNIGAAEVFDCCAEVGSWSPVGEMLGGESRDDSVEYVAMAAHAHFVIIKTVDIDAMKNSVYKIFVINEDGDNSLRQTWTDIDSGSPNISLYVNSAAMSYDGRIIAVGQTVGNFCNQIAVFESVDESIQNYNRRGSVLSFDRADCSDNVLAPYNMALSYFGDTVAIASLSGGPSDTGVVRIFRWDDVIEDWQQIGQDLYGESRGGLFGTSISFDQFATRVSISEPGLPTNIARGKVSVFSLVNREWVKAVQDIFGTNPSQRFGSKVSLSGDGNRLVVGSEGNGGFAEVFDIMM